MDPEDEIKLQNKVPDELPKIHKKCNSNRPHTRLI